MTFITYIKFYCVHVVLMKIVYTSSLLEPDDPGLLWSSEKDQNSPSKQVRTSPGLSGNLEYKWWGWKQGWKYFSVVVCVPSVSDSLVLPHFQPFLFFSISRYTRRDFWMESLVMKLTKFWMSDSLLDSSLSTVGFLIMDLDKCLAWSAKRDDETLTHDLGVGP